MRINNMCFFTGLAKAECRGDQAPNLTRIWHASDAHLWRPGTQWGPDAGGTRVQALCDCFCVSPECVCT